MKKIRKKTPKKIKIKGIGQTIPKRKKKLTRHNIKKRSVNTNRKKKKQKNQFLRLKQVDL